MPTTYSEVKHRHGTLEQYNSIQPEPDSIYFITDTHQIFVGEQEYTKSALSLSVKPKDTDIGEEGRFYFCTQDGSSYIYIGGRWVVVYDPNRNIVTKLTAGEGITCDPNPIANKGTVSHYTPEGATSINPDTSQVEIKLGESFNVTQVKTDKFGHVTGTAQKAYKMPSAEELGTVFKFKGSVQTPDKLPKSNNLTGDVYYVIDKSTEYVYLDNKWEELGPVVDFSGLIPKQPDFAGYVSVFSADGSLVSAGYTPVSGVRADTYGENTANSINIPKLNIDKYGRVTSADNVNIKLADADEVANQVSWILEQFLG